MSRPESILDAVRSAHDIIAMLPDDVHAEVIEGEVIVNSVTPAGRHAKIILAVRRAFARQGIDNSSRTPHFWSSMTSPNTCQT
jgi:hypothetical protein